MMTAFLRTLKRSPLLLISLVLTIGLAVLAIIAPLLWWDAATIAAPPSALMEPSSDHPLGTDALGRDILLRTLVATRLSLGMALGATFLGAVIGMLLGALPAVLGARTQRWFGAVINTWLAFPVLLVAMLIVILLGTSAQTAMIALAVTMVPSFARLAQTLASRVGGSEYLAAARMLGISKSRQFFKYILPNVAEPIIVNVAISIGGGLLALSSLSFLGVGVQSPEFDWGRLLSEAFDQVYSTPVAAVGPGLAVVLAGVTFGMLGEALAGVLRNRSKSHTAPREALGPAPNNLVPPTDVERDAFLVVDGLAVSFRGAQGWVQPVRDVSFSVRRGEIVGVVGESGSGKSLTMMSVAGLAPAAAVVTARELTLAGEDLLESGKASNAAFAEMGIVFQDSLTALNPAHRIGRQLQEVKRVREGFTRRQAREDALAAMEAVGIEGGERRLSQFPHELSGGMRQRVLIAMAQLSRPSLIIADEPTTALDVTVQRRVLSLLRNECEQYGQTAIIVSHDIAVLAELCQRIIVMYAGRVVEDVDVRLLAQPELLAHPYTRALAAALPDLTAEASKPLVTIPGEPPDVEQTITGCAFAPRCDVATEVCHTSVPPLRKHRGSDRVACWNPVSAAMPKDRQVPIRKPPVTAGPSSEEQAQ